MLASSGSPSTVGSPLLSDVTKRLEAIGVDPLSRDWLIKALHPAGGSASLGMPDESYVSVLRPEYRDQTVISCPAALAGATWDLLIWRPPADVNILYWAAAAAGFNFSTGVAFPAAVGYLQMQPVSAGPNLQAADIPGPGTTLYATQNPVARPVGWRTQYAGLTCYLTAASIADQGTVFAGQFQRQFFPRRVAQGTIQAGVSVLHNYTTTNVPFDENAMLLADPRAYTAPARDGVYMPFRLSGPSQPFVGATSPVTGLFLDAALGFHYATGEVAIAAGPPVVHGFMPSHLPYNLQPDGLGSYVTSPGSSFIPVGGGTTFAPPSLDTGYDNVHQGVVIFRGLSGQASVTCKSYTGLEVIPSVDSPDRVFVKPPVKFNPRAMEAYYAVIHDMPTCYPASYNSFGTILSSIGGVVGKLWPTIKRVVPIVGRALEEIIEGPNDAAASAVAAAPPVRSLRALGPPPSESALQSRPRKPKGKKKGRVVRMARVSSRSRSRSRR